MNDLIALLLDRLLWPSCLAKERACRELAELLIQEQHSTDFSDALCEWIVSQTLETTCAYGLLVMVRARLDGAKLDEPKLAEVAQRIRSRSLLSGILFREMGLNVSSYGQAPHSSDAPLDFSAPEFFNRYIESFLPPIYRTWGERLDEIARGGFIRQWAFEWQLLMESEMLSQSSAAGEYWGRQHSGEGFGPASTRISEVYLSAFLRALAWAYATKKVSEDIVLFFVEKTCPVDLAFWRIPVHPMPEWWPLVEGSEGGVDVTPVTVWERLEQLWNKQEGRKSWTGSGSLGAEQVLIAAAGVVGTPPHSSELRILGAFQRCLGSGVPESAKVFEILSDNQNLVRLEWNRTLRCEGKVVSHAPEDFRKRIGDWLIVPCSAWFMPPTRPRWQAWRMHHALYVPLPFLAGGENAIEGAVDRITFTGQKIGEAAYSDWHRGIHEHYDHRFPEATGFFLTVPRTWIEHVEERLGVRFVWICHLEAYQAERWSEDVKTASDYRTFGASSIVLPD